MNKEEKTDERKEKETKKETTQLLSAFILLGPVLWPEYGRYFEIALGRTARAIRRKQTNTF